MTKQTKLKLEDLAVKLMAAPRGYIKLLELATGLLNKGRRDEASHLEAIILEHGDAEARHRWRLSQQARAPANQYLLINNEHRTAAFQRALESIVQIGHSVLEIGTGSGILAMLAAKAGAGKVYTCEHQPMMATVAAAIVADNGMEEIVHVLAKSSDTLVLGTDIPEKVDVIVCDVFTGSLLEAGGLGLVARAAEKFLKPGGKIIPGAGSISGCLVGGSDLEALCRSSNAGGLDLSRFNLFSPTKLQLQHDQFRQLDYLPYSASFCCFEFQIGAPESVQVQQKKIQVKTTKGGRITGLLQWTDLELVPGVSLKAAPEYQIRWPRFLHVFPDPISVAPGQTLNLKLDHNVQRFSVWPEL